MNQANPMHRYILGASPDKQTAIIRPFDKDGKIVGDWREYNAGIVYLAEDVDRVINALQKIISLHDRTDLVVAQEIAEKALRASGQEGDERG